MQSEGGLREQHAQARGANASDDDLGQVPVPLADRAAARAAVHNPPTIGAPTREPTPTHGSGTKRVDGQSNHSARARDADASDDDILWSKFPFAARAAVQTPPTIAAPRRQLTPTQRPAPRMPSLNVDSDDDGALPEGTSSSTVRTPRGSASAALERPEREPLRSSGAARRRRARDAAMADDVDGLADLMADLRGRSPSTIRRAIASCLTWRPLFDVRRSAACGIRRA